MFLVYHIYFLTATIKPFGIFQVLCGIFLFNPHFDRATSPNFCVGFQFLPPISGERLLPTFVWDFLRVNKKHEKIWHPVWTPDFFLVVLFLFFGIEGFRQKPLNSHGQRLSFLFGVVLQPFAEDAVNVAVQMLSIFFSPWHGHPPARSAFRGIVPVPVPS